MSQQSEFSSPGGLFSTLITQTSNASSQSEVFSNGSNNTTPSTSFIKKKKARVSVETAKKKNLDEKNEFRNATMQLSLVSEEIHSNFTIKFLNFF